jgi:hypothetical protein
VLVLFAVFSLSSSIRCAREASGQWRSGSRWVGGRDWARSCWCRHRPHGEGEPAAVVLDVPTGRHHRAQLGEGQRGGVFPVFEANKAIVEVENFLYATSQIAQTTLRSIPRRPRARQPCAREQIPTIRSSVLKQADRSWGIGGSSVELRTSTRPPESEARQGQAKPK